MNKRRNLLTWKMDHRDQAMHARNIRNVPIIHWFLETTPAACLPPLSLRTRWRFRGLSDGHAYRVM
jgi:hypothetical protein